MRFWVVFLVSVFLLAPLRGQSVAVRFADSEMVRAPEAWQLDHGKRLYFGYGQGLATLAMFMYALAKAVNKGYLDASYREVAERAYAGLMQELIVEEDGLLSLTRCCAVAGLWGNPYRYGRFEYYVNERIRDNDAKGNGPFIMGCLELGK